MLADLRFALRQLLKSPGFTAVAVLSLALGIGANTAIFSLVNDFLLRSLPVRNPDELVLLRQIAGARGRMPQSESGNSSKDPTTGRTTGTSFSILTLQRFQAHHPALAEVFGFAPFYQVNVLIDGQPEASVSAQFVSGNYHAGLGVGAILGRTLTPDDDQPSAAPVAVITDRYWQNRFGRDSSVLGRTIQVNKVPVTIVGVTMPGFNGAQQVGDTSDISVPLAHFLRFQPDNAEAAQPWSWWVRIMGRLAPGFTAAQARAGLEPLFQDTAREGWKVSQTSATTPSAMPDAPTLAADPGGQGENDNRRQYRQSLRLLVGLVSLVLLAACANVANLLLARGAARRREVAVRLALGASRGRIVRQLLAEALLLALLGATFGTLFAWWGRGLLLASRPFGNANLVLDLPLDGRVLAFTIVVAVATALLFGLAPALRAARVDLNAEFQGGTRSLGSGGRSRLSQALMVVQIALSLVLLVSTALFVRTLRNLQDVDAGFNRRQLVLFRIDATSAGYSKDQFAPLQIRLLDRFEKLPSARGATFSQVALLNRGRWSSTIGIPGFKPAPGISLNVYFNAVAPNFFATLEIPLLLGRTFTERDDVAAPKVAIVNQAFVQKYFNGDNPVGRIFSSGSFKEIQIVGLVRDAKYANLRDEAPPTVYLPALQRVTGIANFAVRANAGMAPLYPSIRAAVREIDPTLPVLGLRTQDEQLERNHAQERLFARLSGFFGALALALACVGLYGLMSYAVVRRTGEIGLRMALGALPGHVLRMVLRESLALVCLGVVAGLSGAHVASRLIASMLFGLSATDPFTYAIVALMLIAVALVASLLPARRASQVDPMTALRAD